MIVPSAAKQLLRRYLPHRREYYLRWLFERVTPTELGEFLQSLGVRPGMVLFVHSAFSRLGYFTSGAIGFVQLLKELVGPKGMIVMPAFAFNGSMADYVAMQPSFDVRRTPSSSGYLTEVFRTQPGVRRSLHPTHSVCALGACAPEFVSGHESCITPCGAQSPFGKLSALGAYVLRVGTGSLTLHHHVQELADYPNLFLDGLSNLTCVDDTGRQLCVGTRVYRPHIPDILFLGESPIGQADTVHPSNFPLLFGGDREEHLRADPRQQEVLRRLIEIRQSFEAKGWLTRAWIRECACELLDVHEYVTFAVAAEREVIAGFAHKYDLARLERLFDDGEFPPI